MSGDAAPAKPAHGAEPGPLSPTAGLHLFFVEDAVGLGDVIKRSDRPGRGIK